MAELMKLAAALVLLALSAAPAGAEDAWTPIGEEGGATLYARPGMADEGARGVDFRREYAAPVKMSSGDRSVDVRSRFDRYRLDCAERTLTLVYSETYAKPNLQARVGYVWGRQTGAKPVSWDKLKVEAIQRVLAAACA